MKVIIAEKNRPHTIERIIIILIVNMLVVPSQRFGIAFRYIKKYIKANITRE
jgi:hypothetical protein